MYHTGVGWVMQGWGGSYRGGVGHEGWCGSCRGGVGHASVGWGGSCRGAVGHAVHVGVGWVNNSYSFKNSQMDMRGCV